MNAMVAYGEAIAAVCGASTNLVVGSNASICINPSAFFSRYLDISPAIKALLMGGAGGNLAFTLGSNTTMTMGPAYEVNWGKKYEFNLGDCGKEEINIGPVQTTVPKLVNYSFGSIIVLFVMAMFIAYGLTKDETVRARLLVSLQIILNITISVLLAIDVAFHNSAQKQEDLFKGTYKLQTTGKGWEKVKTFAAMTASLVSTTLAPAIVPGIMEAKSENHFNRDV